MGFITFIIDLIHLAYVMLPYIYVGVWIDIIKHRCIRKNKDENLKNTTFFQDIKIRITRHAFNNLRLSQGAFLTGPTVSRMLMWSKTSKYDGFKKIYSEIMLEDTFKAVWYADKETKRADDDIVIYFVHGGGFCICCVEFYTEWCLELRRHLRQRGYEKVSLFAIEYDIVPTARYPLALRAVTAGYSHLINVEKINPNKIVMIGDSAGGNLTMAMLLHIARPSAVVLGQQLTGHIKSRESEHSSKVADKQAASQAYGGMDEKAALLENGNGNGHVNGNGNGNIGGTDADSGHLHADHPHKNFHYDARAAAVAQAEAADPFDASQASTQRIMPKPALAAIISPWCMFDSEESSWYDNQSSDILTFPHVKHVARIYCHAEDKEYPRNWNPIKIYNGTATGRKDGRAYREEDEAKFVRACKNPYVNPGACRDPKWWREAMPDYGSLYTAGSAELFRDDAVKAYEYVKECGVPKTNLIVDSGTHDWVCMDLVIGAEKGLGKYRGPRLLSRWIIKRMRQVPGATGVPAEDIQVKVSNI